MCQELHGTILQDSVDIVSVSSNSSVPDALKETDLDTQLSLNSGFTEDSLNIDSGSDKETGGSGDSGTSDSAKADKSTARHTSSPAKVRSSSENLLESEGSDTENDDLNTVKQRYSPHSSHSSLDKERQEDLDIFGLPPDYYARFEEDDDEMEGEFYFDRDLNLDCDIEDQIVAAELLRPERLDTVEEVSEPPSNSNSLPMDGVRWQEHMSQHTSITSIDPFASLTSVGDEDKEQLYSVNELEFRNSLRSQHSLISLDKSCASLPNLPSGADSGQVLRSQLSDDRTLAQIEQLGRKVGLDPENLTYVKNPFEIFHIRQSVPIQQYPEKVELR